MATKCTHCLVIWAELKEERDDANNQINELCPICNSAAYFEETDEKPAYKMVVSGDIIDADTGELIPRKPVFHIKPAKKFDVDAWRVKKSAAEKRVDAALEAYQKAKGGKKNKQKTK